MPTLSFTDSLFSAFVQDDWRLSSSFKMVYGARYVCIYPDGVPNATYAPQHFNIDKNNVAPRVGRVPSARPEDRCARAPASCDQPLLASSNRATRIATVAPLRQPERHG